MKPLAIDLFCGLGGWTEGLLAEGYDVIGFDIERHEYDEHRYPAQLVIQDVRTLHGSQFRDAALIVASPPCQAYSYRAMPWKRAHELPPPDNSLFEACFRIQREAREAAGRHIPLIVENVRGAQKWVGRARWNFGSFYLWGDVSALMPSTLKIETMKNTGGSWFTPPEGRHCRPKNCPDGRASGDAPWIKAPGFRFDGSGWSFQSASVEGVKAARDGAGAYGGSFGWDDTPLRRGNSKSPQRKMASAMIAKIPLPLARHIAAVYRPEPADAYSIRQPSRHRDPERLEGAEPAIEAGVDRRRGGVVE